MLGVECWVLMISTKCINVLHAINTQHPIPHHPTFITQHPFSPTPNTQHPS
ncbi:hypothetical protein HMPREF1505_1523 [Prevotella sp. ICM33]|nr:hypothetical protein HMPREF1505_1523 [Prevotella sp. ICM33]